MAAAAAAATTATAGVRAVLQLASAAPVGLLAAACAALRPPARAHRSRAVGGAGRGRHQSRLQARAR